jgi:hypothetical protein
MLVSFMGQQNQSVGQVEMKNFPALMKQILPVGLDATFDRVPVVAPAGSVLRAKLEKSGPGDRFCDFEIAKTGTNGLTYGTIVLGDSIAHPSGSPSAIERAAASLTSDSSLIGRQSGTAFGCRSCKYIGEVSRLADVTAGSTFDESL